MANFVILAALLFPLEFVYSQLVVNVKNRGGDVVVETIQANTSQDVVELHFQNTDGTFFSQFIDYRSEVQVFRAYEPWEEEQGFSQNKPQVLCFVLHFNKNEFISSDAMSKLRQKNPTAIRMPEEERPAQSHLKDLTLHVDKLHLLSPHLYNICKDAKDTVFAQEADIKTWSRSLGKELSVLMSMAEKSNPEKHQHCHQITDLSKPCLCTYDFTVGWYPCGLKYCRGKDSAGKYVSYRCGIKTCKRHITFDFVSRQKMFCLWDQP